MAPREHSVWPQTVPIPRDAACNAFRNPGENMRHAKGTIALSQEQDLPMLRQVLNSQFITHTQL